MLKDRLSAATREVPQATNLKITLKVFKTVKSCLPRTLRPLQLHYYMCSPYTQRKPYPNARVHLSEGRNGRLEGIVY